MRPISRLTFALFCLLYAFLYASVTSALPTITGIRWEVQRNADGTYPCNRYALALRYAQSPAQLRAESFGLEVRRDAEFYEFQSEVSTRQHPYTFTDFSGNNHFPDGLPSRIEVRTVSNDGRVSP